MARHNLIFAVLLALLAGSWTLSAQSAPLQSGRDVLDADTMKAGLRTASREEDGFIEYVLELVDEGRLPADMVASTFQWARQKPRLKFQYFKRGLILRARKIGIRL